MFLCAFFYHKDFMWVILYLHLLLLFYVLVGTKGCKIPRGTHKLWVAGVRSVGPSMEHLSVLSSCFWSLKTPGSLMCLASYCNCCVSPKDAATGRKAASS